MDHIFLSLFQALQLVALGPCLFLVAFLLLVVRRPAAVVVPCLYFLSLSASFLLPILPVLGSGLEHEGPSVGGLIFTFMESLMPALSFLLMLQLIHGTPPHLVCWLVLALPILGGSSFVYGALYLDEVCLRGIGCLPASSLMALYQLTGSGLIFLLLLVYSARQPLFISGEDQRRTRHQYWLVIALIGLNLLLMALNLAALTGALEEQKTAQAVIIIRLGFIYLVMTSLFRVFDGQIELDAERIPTLARAVDVHRTATGRVKESDEWILSRLTRAMERDCAYREIEGGREALALKIGVPEHQLSRVINAHFGKSVSEYLNDFRIQEAAARLRTEATAITTIAYEVGFGSIATFNRVFKEKLGQSPSAWRAGEQEAPSCAES